MGPICERGYDSPGQLGVKIRKLKRGEKKMPQIKSIAADTYHVVHKECFKCAFRDGVMNLNGACNYISVIGHRRPHKVKDCPGYSYEDAVKVIQDCLYFDKEETAIDRVN